MKDIITMLLKNLPFPLWIKDLSLKNIFVNEAYASIYNRKIDDSIGHKFEDIIDKDTADKYNKICDEVIKTGNIQIGKGTLNKVYRECTIFPIKDDNNKIIALCGIILDKQELINKDEEIKDQSKVLKAIIDTLPGVIFYKDRGIDNIIGKTDFDINPNKEQCEKFLKDDKFILANKKSIHNEIRFKDKQEQVEYREVIKSPAIDEDGNIRGIVGFSRDITAKILAKKRLQYLSYTDILTGVYNRTYFEEKMQKYNEDDIQVGVIMTNIK